MIDPDNAKAAEDIVFPAGLRPKVKSVTQEEFDDLKHTKNLNKQRKLLQCL